MIGVQNENAIHGANDDVVDLVLLGRHGKHHAQEVGGVGQVVARIHEGLTHRVLVGHGNHGRHLGDQANR